MTKKFISLSLAALTLILGPLEAFEIGLGYRRDELKWTETVPTPLDMKTEEKWKANVNLLTIKDEFMFCNRIYLKAVADYGWVNNGKKALDQFFTQSDEPSSKKGWLKARSKGQIYDLSWGLGYHFGCFEDQLGLMPLVGYSYQRQRFKDNHYTEHYYQVNLIKETQSSYSYRWEGPWVGALFSYKWACIKCFAEYQYHWGKYCSKVADRLFTGVPSNKQKSSHVHGNDFTVGFAVNLCLLTVGIAGNYKIWTAGKGTSKTHDETIILNHVRWQSLSASVFAGTRF